MHPCSGGLHIHEHWDWSVSHPVVRLSFGGKYNEPGDLHNHMISQLAMIVQDADLDPGADCTGPERLQNLLHRTTGKRAMVLLDEYGKPILDVIDNPEMSIANGNYLRGFYGIIKDRPQDVRFVLPYRPTKDIPPTHKYLNLLDETLGHL